MKQKLFNFTDRTVELLKIVSALNKTSETETLEIALELMATPEVIALINSIHGERVDRKTLRKPRTSKKKLKSEPLKEEIPASIKQDNPISIIEDNKKVIVENTKEDIIEDSKEIYQEYKSDTLEELEEIEEASTPIEAEEEKEEDINDSIFDLNMCDDSLLDMYS